MRKVSFWFWFLVFGPILWRRDNQKPSPSPRCPNGPSRQRRRPPPLRAPRPSSPKSPGPSQPPGHPPKPLPPKPPRPEKKPPPTRLQVPDPDPKQRGTPRRKRWTSRETRPRLRSTRASTGERWEGGRSRWRRPKRKRRPKAKSDGEGLRRSPTAKA